MTDPQSRTTREISDINCLCLTTHKLLKNLQINNVLQRRILGGLSEDEFRSIINHEAGKTLKDDKVKGIEVFYNNVYLMSLCVAPHSEDIENTWLNTKDPALFEGQKPLDYLIRNERTGIHTVAYTLTTKRILILAENWGLDKLQIENLSKNMDNSIVNMLLFTGKALEVLLPTPEERTQWMQKPNPDFDNRAPVNVIGSGEYEPVFKVFSHLYVASNGAKGWVPRFDYKVEGEPHARHRQTMAFRLL